MIFQGGTGCAVVQKRCRGNKAPEQGLVGHSREKPSVTFHRATLGQFWGSGREHGDAQGSPQHTHERSIR